MTIPGATPLDAISVAELTAAAKTVLEGAFAPLWVKGEISGFKAYPSGHWYFTIKDETSQLACVVWKGSTRGIPSRPADGMQVMARGQLSVYVARGQMQFSVSAIEAEGEGLWKKQFDETKAKLDRDGITTRPRKPIPRFPRCVAVITSSEGAALRDIVSVVRRRHVGVDILILPAQVQGEGAPDSICAALAQLDRLLRTEGIVGITSPEVLIIGRGGGSREDLWAFNNEAVARAIAACAIPTISAVGHETDVTIADLVADLRAATPSVAAEHAVPLLAEVQGLVAQLAGTMADALQDRVIVGQRELARRAEGLALRAQRLTERRRAKAQRLVERIAHQAPRLVERRRTAIAAISGRLQALSPLAVLERGFVVARGADGRTLSRRAAFTAGAPFELLLTDGRVRAQTESVHDDASHLRSDR